METLGQKMKDEFNLGAKLTDRQAKGRTGLITIQPTFFPKKYGYIEKKGSVRIEASTLTPEASSTMRAFSGALCSGTYLYS